MNNINSKLQNLSQTQLDKNRGYYIAEAGLEYLVSLLITDAFLSYLLKSTGVADSIVPIITELAKLAFSAQLVSVFFRKTRGLKKFVTVMHLINQGLFVLLYFVPIFNLTSSAKIILIVIAFLGGHFVANVVSPYKISWFMSFVEDKKRGRFTANKEIVSLAAGAIFSMTMGSVSDYYKALGREDIYFTICGFTIFVLAVLHMLSIILVKDFEEKEDCQNNHISFSKALKITFSNKALLALIALDMIWQFASNLSLSTYGVYKTETLAFSMKYVAVLGVVSSLSRIAFSRYFGKLADKFSWKRMLGICFAIATVSFAINIFTVPSNGKILFMIYSCVHAVSMAGINSGLMNIIFDYVVPEDRAPALGIRTALGGLTAFASSFVSAAVISAVQKNNNIVLGKTIYPQQILSAATTVICILMLVYMVKVVEKLRKN